VELISVVIPVFNKQDTVERCIRSVTAQTFVDIEIIAIDDGSSDGSATILRTIRDPRLKVHSIPNGGVSRARNLGLSLATAEVVCFLDADDYWSDRFVERMNLLFKQCADAALLCGRYQIENEDGSTRLGSYSLPSDHFGYVENFFRTYRKSKSLVCSSSVGVRRQALIDIGGFPADATVGEDVYVWLELAKRHAVAADSEVCSTVSYDDARNDKRAITKIPYFIGANLKYAQKKDADRDLIAFIAYYSKIYAALAVLSGTRKTALNYFNAWKGVRASTAIACLCIYAVPSFVWSFARQTGRSLARRRSKHR
jgi:glycosyltransferase involved in cell wall biosynthesis